MVHRPLPGTLSRQPASPRPGGSFLACPAPGPRPSPLQSLRAAPHTLSWSLAWVLPPSPVCGPLWPPCATREARTLSVSRSSPRSAASLPSGWRIYRVWSRGRRPPRGRPLSARLHSFPGTPPCPGPCGAPTAPPLPPLDSTCRTSGGQGGLGLPLLPPQQPGPGPPLHASVPLCTWPRQQLLPPEAAAVTTSPVDGSLAECGCQQASRLGTSPVVPEWPAQQSVLAEGQSSRAGLSGCPGPGPTLKAKRVTRCPP